MSLEQSLDRLATLIEQLIGQLEAGRKGQAAPAAETKSAAVSAAIATKAEVKATAAAAAPDAAAPTLLDYVKDVAPRFSLLVAKDRPAAVALMHGFKADAKKLEEAILGADGKHDQVKMAEALVEINTKLGG